MDEEKLLDARNGIDLEGKLKIEKKRLVVSVIVFIIVNTLLFTLFIKGYGNYQDKFLTALNANVIGFNMIGMILGGIGALIPYKNLSYSKKYMRATLYCILIIHVIITIGIFIMEMLH